MKKWRKKVKEKGRNKRRKEINNFLFFHLRTGLSIAENYWRKFARKEDWKKKSLEGSLGGWKGRRERGGYVAK